MVLFQQNAVFGQAQEPPALDTIEKLQALQEAREKLGEMSAIVERVTANRYHDCLRAFGHITFCTCLRDNIPALASLSSYIEIVTQTKDELQYDSLNPTEKGFIDRIYVGRNECAQRSFGKGRETETENSKGPLP
jgi:hypothetical protein